LASSGTHQAEIHFAPGDAAALAKAAELREGLLDQFLSLVLHLAERGGDKDADFTLGEWIRGWHNGTLLYPETAHLLKEGGLLAINPLRMTK
jgi:hypothetical protein